MLSKEQVEHIARLANLTLSEKEVERLQKELSETLEYIEVLNELDTDNVKPTYQVTGLFNVLRKDEKRESLSQEEALSGTDQKLGGYFKVKSLFEDL